MITEWIADLAVQVLDATGYFGAGLLMALESMIAPVPSEAVMAVIRAGDETLLRANLIITRAVETAGGSISYGIESVDEKRRWKAVTLGITDGDSLVREVRLEKRLR